MKNAAQNAYLLAKIGADTAENGRNFAESLPKIGNYSTGPLPYRSSQQVQEGEPRGPQRQHASRDLRRPHVDRSRPPLRPGLPAAEKRYVCSSFKLERFFLNF